MEREQVSAASFIEQVIAKAIIKKEGKKLKPNQGQQYEFIVNPAFFESEL